MKSPMKKVTDNSVFMNISIFMARLNQIPDTRIAFVLTVSEVELC